MRRLPFALLLAVTACGEDVALDPGVARSGSRLALYRYVYDQATDEVETRWFHDRVRDERCTPRRWSDGVTYCTPDAAEAVYITADCTQLHARAPEGAPAPVYGLRHYWLERTWHPSRLYRVVGPTRPAEMYWELRDGACLGPYNGAGFTYYALGEEIDRAGLVRVTRPELAQGHHLAVSGYASADGLQVPTALRDLELDVPCALDERPGAATTACPPDDAVSARYFRDAACRELAIQVGTGQEPPTRVRYFDESSGCTSYHSVAEEIEVPLLYQQVGGACVDVVVSTNDRFYAAGPTLALAPLDRVPDPAAGRIQPIHVTDGALRLRDPLLHDAALGVDCRRAELDGTSYCIPAAIVDALPLFTDAACTAAQPTAIVREGACVPEPTIATALGPAGQTLHALEAPHTGALFHISTGEQCVPYTVPAGHVARTVGPALPLSTFARAELVVDP